MPCLTPTVRPKAPAHGQRALARGRGVRWQRSSAVGHGRGVSLLLLIVPLWAVAQALGCRNDRPAPTVPTAPTDAGPTQDLDSGVAPIGPIARDREAIDGGD
jgi:hypothetical protein